MRIKALTVLLQPMDCILRAASQPLEYAGTVVIDKLEAILLASVLSVWCRQNWRRKVEVQDSSRVCGEVQHPTDRDIHTTSPEYLD